MQISDSRPMSQRAYAKRRGVSAMAVSRAIKSRRLRESVRDGKIIDPDLADREWAANTDYSEGGPRAAVEKTDAAIQRQRDGDIPAPGARHSQLAQEGMSLSEASAAEKVWKAKLAELKYRETAGELVPAAEVRGKLEDTFRTCRTKLLGIPSRARQALPHLSVADIGALEDLVREALEDLAAAGAVA